MQFRQGVPSPRSWLLALLLFASGVVIAGPPNPFVATSDGINIPQGQPAAQIGDPPREGFLSKTGSAFKRSASGFTNGFKSLLKSDKPAADPNVPDPWLGSKKARDPDASLFVAFARLQEQSSGFQHAELYYRRALQKDPKCLDALLGLARLYERMEQPTKALELYRQAVGSYPDQAPPHNDLALCYERLGRTPEAIASLERAITIDPHRKLYRNNIARPLVAMGRLEDAYAQLTAVYPPAIAYYNLGYLLKDRGNYRAALNHFARAAEIDPSFAEARQWHSQLASRLGNQYIARRPTAPRLQYERPSSLPAPPVRPTTPINARPPLMPAVPTTNASASVAPAPPPTTALAAQPSAPATNAPSLTESTAPAATAPTSAAGSPIQQEQESRSLASGDAESQPTSTPPPGAIAESSSPNPDGPPSGEAPNVAENGEEPGDGGTVMPMANDAQARAVAESEIESVPSTANHPAGDAPQAAPESSASGPAGSPTTSAVFSAVTMPAKSSRRLVVSVGQQKSDLVVAPGKTPEPGDAAPRQQAAPEPAAKPVNSSAKNGAGKPAAAVAQKPTYRPPSRY